MFIGSSRYLSCPTTRQTWSLRTQSFFCLTHRVLPIDALSDSPCMNARIEQVLFMQQPWQSLLTRLIQTLWKTIAHNLPSWSSSGQNISRCSEAESTPVSWSTLMRWSRTSKISLPSAMPQLHTRWLIGLCAKKRVMRTRWHALPLHAHDEMTCTSPFCARKRAEAVKRAAVGSAWNASHRACYSLLETHARGCLVMAWLPTLSWESCKLCRRKAK